MTYQITCTCGDHLTTMANSKEEAILNFKGMMTPEAAVQHMMEKHRNQPIPSQEEAYRMIETTIEVV